MLERSGLREESGQVLGGGEGSFPDLGDTVGEAGASPHRSKGQQKYRSSPVAVHEKAGAREPRPCRLPLFTLVRGMGILRSSHTRSSTKFVSSEGMATWQ